MILFPSDPSTGQQYVGDNGATYTWTGDRWSSTIAIANKTAAIYAEGGYSDSVYNSVIDTDLDGGYSTTNLYDRPVLTIDSITDHGWGILRIIYTYSNVTGYNWGQAGIIIGTGSVNYATAIDPCDAGDGTATKFPYRDVGPEYDCNSATWTDLTDVTVTVDLPVYEFSGSNVNIVAYLHSKDGDDQTFYTDIIRRHIDYIPCFGAGTQITLADGSKRAIEEITYNDELRVWDFDNGATASAKPLWIKKKQTSPLFNRSHFADGTVLDTLQYVKGHRVFNKTQSKFTFIFDCQPGDVIVKDNGTETTYVGWEVVKEKLDYYNIFTEHHMNMYANDVLTSTGFNNLYPIEDMKFVKEARVPRSYEGIAEYWISGLRLAENTTEDVAGMARHLQLLDSLGLGK